MRRPDQIETWIGQAVAVNSRAGHLVGIVADVGGRGLTLERSGPRDSTTRATRWLPWGAVHDVILASSLSAPDDIEPSLPTSHKKEI